MVKHAKKQHNKLQIYEKQIKQWKQKKLTMADVFEGRCHYCKCQYPLEEERDIQGYKSCEDCCISFWSLVHADSPSDILNSPFQIMYKENGKYYYHYRGPQETYMPQI
jgi:hypothetical protein